MTCDWHDGCSGTGAFEYSGWFLLSSQDQEWVIRPYQGGRGGAPVPIPGDAESWAEICADGDVVTAVEGEIGADSHPGEGGWEPVLFSSSSTKSIAQRCRRIQVQGTSWRLSFRGGRLVVPRFQDVSDQEANWLQDAQAWVWGDPPGPTTWQFEDADAYLRERQSRAHTAVESRWAAARRASVTAGVVNPYNFVPLGGLAPTRGPASGHVGLADDRLSGRVDVVLKALTPLALAGEGRGTQASPSGPAWLDNGWYVHGSSLAGVARSVHEALTDSCLRVIDLAYLPVHRDQAKVPQGTWRLARVCEGGGAALLSRGVPYDSDTFPCVWVEARRLAGISNAGHWLSGDVAFHFDPLPGDLTVIRRRLEANERAAPPVRCPGGSCGNPQHWRAVVSSAIDGRVLIPSGPRQHPYHVAFAPEPCDGPITISTKAVAEYEHSAHDAADVVTRRRPPPSDQPDLHVLQFDSGRKSLSSCSRISFSGRGSSAERSRS